MFTRQATRFLIVLSLLCILWACSSSPQPVAIPSAPPPTSTYTPLPIPTLPSATPTSLTCLDQPGQLQTGQIPTNGSPTNFIIYLPPCYDFFHEWRYPTLYLLNGLPMDSDPSSVGTQWIRIGAPAAADALIRSGDYPPFIIVFPEDRYWNVPQGTLFGDFMANDIVPFIDKNFRTIADRPHRAVGGLSRGGGWALRLSIYRPDLFGIVGLHSPAVFAEERASMELLLRDTDPAGWPRLYIDTGREDHELGYNTLFEGLLTEHEIPHQWHLNIGQHNEDYWSRHVMEYLMWYAEGFQAAGPPLPTPTPTATFLPSLTPTASATPTAGATEPTVSSTPGPTASPSLTPAP